MSRDPFSKAVDLRELEPATLLLDDGHSLDLRGKAVWVAGLDPVSRGREPDLSQARRPLDPPLALSHGARPARRRALRSRARRSHARRADLRAVPRREAPPRPSDCALHAWALPPRAARPCTCRPASARRSCPSGSARAPRRRSSFCDPRRKITRVEAEAGPHISSDVVARYAADATLEVDGVEGLVQGPRAAPRRCACHRR